ncbi:MAG: acylneuraminate cytidylyltransferase family protein [Nanoarchaeota archaeon]
MYKDQFVLGVIPARGGSKGIPKKNIKPLAGKPLIAWTIEIAKKSKYLDKTIVSTDDPAIKQVAEEFGGEVPFMRPAELATDTTAMIPVIRHACETMEKLLKRKIDVIVLLDPTAPLRSVEDIDTCISRCVDEKRDSVITVAEAEKNPYFNMMEIGSDGRAHLVKTPEKPIFRRQDAPKVYNVTSGAYALSRAFLFNCVVVHGKNTAAVIIPEERAGHIDSEIEFLMVEEVMRRRK